MPLQTGSADLSHFEEDEPTVEKATLDAHITEVIGCQYCLSYMDLLYYILERYTFTARQKTKLIMK